MTTEIIRQGGCLCGAVRFTVTGEPNRQGLCHCLDCRKTSGSAFQFFAIWPRDTFRSTGELRTFNGRSFCPTCGSRVASLDDEEAEIMIGSLDAGTSDVVPQYELWTGRRENWLLKLPWADQYAHDRTDDAGNLREPLTEG